MSDFDYINVVFENCDTVRVPPELVRRCVLRDVHTTVFTNFAQQLVETKECQEFELELEIEALSLRTHWQEVDDDGDTFDKHLNIYRDITHIAIHHPEGEYYIAIPWVSEDEYDLKNTLLKSEFNDETVIISSKYS